MKYIKYLLSQCRPINFSIIILVIVGIYACTDQENITDVGSDIKDDQHIGTRSPSTIGDRVYFADFDDFETYYSDIESMMISNGSDYFDSIVNLTTSVTTLNDVIAFSTVGTFGVVSDPVMRAIVNANNEFEIDGALITIIHDDQWLISDASNSMLQTAIRGLTKGTKVAIGNIPAGAYWANPSELGMR